MFPIYSPEDFFAGKKDAKPIGWMSSPAAISPVFVDMATFERLAGKEHDE